MRYLLLVFAFVPMLLLGQSRKQRKAMEAQKKADQQIISNLKLHLRQLDLQNANGQDEMQEAYIIGQFKAIGLQPKGDTGFVQRFKLDYGKQPANSTFLKVNGDELEQGKDYFPLPYSAAGSVTGMPAMALREKGVPWFANIEDWIGDSANAKGDINEALQKEATKIAAKGATALLVYNTGPASGLQFNNMDTSPGSAIPIIYIMPAAYNKYFSDHSQILDIGLNVEFKEVKAEATNIAGYIDNGAATTIIITSYYNREPDTVKHTDSGINTSHPTVKDNSSTALLIELARMLGMSKTKNNNYLFIASDCPGLACIEKRIAINSAQENYLLNLEDARLYGEEKKVVVSSYPTSPAWPQFILPENKLDIAIDSSLSGDVHALSYRKNVPVLSFSTANHPKADTAILNYESILEIARLIDRFVEAADNKGQLAIAGSDPGLALPADNNQLKPPLAVNNEKANQSSLILKTTVSLGIIPDKNSSSAGLKISGVSPKKLAEKLGLQAGDILTALGSHSIENMKTYMQALAAFKPGDKTILHIKRGKEDKEFAVEF